MAYKRAKMTNSAGFANRPSQHQVEVQPILEKIKRNGARHAKHLTKHVQNIWEICREGTKMNENRCPEASKEQVGGRTQCAKQRLKYLQNVSKFIENRGLEGSKIKENRDLEGSSGSSWHVWRDSV